MPEIRVLIEARNAASLRRARADVRGIGLAARESSVAVQGLVGALGIIGTAQIGRGLLRTADAATSINNRIRVATEGTEEFNRVFRDLQVVAQEARADLGGVAQGFSLVNLAINDTERSTALIQALSQSVALAGGTQANLNAVIRQFGQAAGEGILRAQEFNSLIEQAPVFVRALADQLGLTTGELRNLVIEGQASFDLIEEAGVRAADNVNRAFQRAIPTIEQRLQQLENRFTVITGRIDEFSGATQALGEAIQFASENLDVILPVAAGLAAGLVTLTGAAILPLIAALGLLSGPILAVTAGIGLLAAGVTAYTLNASRAGEVTDELRESIEGLTIAQAGLNLQNAIAEADRLNAAFRAAREEAMRSGTFNPTVVGGNIEDEETARLRREANALVERRRAQLELLTRIRLGGGPDAAQTSGQNLGIVQSTRIDIPTDDGGGGGAGVGVSRSERDPIGDFQRRIEFRNRILGLSRNQVAIERELESLRQNAQAAGVAFGQEQEDAARRQLEALQEQRDAYGLIEDAATSTADTIANALGQAAESGKLSIRDLARDVLSSLSRIGSQQFIAPFLQNAIGGGLRRIFTNPSTGFLGSGRAASGTFSTATFAGSFQQGGAFTIPGSGGPDSQLIALRGTPGETITLTPPGEEFGGNAGRGQRPIVQNFNFPPQTNVQSLRRNRRAIQREALALGGLR